jgi:hypothetical protein
MSKQIDLKKLKKNLLVESAIKTFGLLKKNPRDLLYIISADILFILVYGILSFAMVERLREYLLSAGAEIASRSAEITQQVMYKSVFEVLFSYPEIGPLISSIFWLLLLIILTAYVLFSVFQGYAWKISLKMIGRKVSYYNFSMQFILINILWIILFYSQRIFTVFSQLLNFMAEKVSPGTSTSAYHYISMIFLIAIVYFAVISYSLIGKYSIAGILKKTFAFGVRKAKYFLPMYALVAILFWLINFILHQAGSINKIAFLIAGFVLVFPAFAFSRVYIALIVNKLIR